MNIALDLDSTVFQYPEFFIPLCKAWKKTKKNKVIVVTGQSRFVAVGELKRFCNREKIKKPFYDEVFTSANLNAAEREIDRMGLGRDLVIGLFKQRICKEHEVVFLFDTQASLHKSCGDTPVFEVPCSNKD